MTEAAWIISALTGLLLLAGGAIIVDHRERLKKLESEQAEMEQTSDRVRLNGFQRLASVEKAIEGVVQIAANLRQDIMARFDKQDGRLDRIEGKLDRNGRP